MSRVVDLSVVAGIDLVAEPPEQLYEGCSSGSLCHDLDSRQCLGFGMSKIVEISLLYRGAGALYAFFQKS